ncbi:MAG TPA: DUF1648 domain-containing protein [Caldisericia bacterium]|nr:DUF1648 domain-containing protein [Caldisericia bacterium]
MKIRKSEIMIFVFILLCFIIGIYFYPQMPDKIASHWNAQGEVDGYMPKAEGLFTMPIMFTFLGLLFIIIPRVDPKKENIEKFRKYYDGFIIIFFIFMISTYINVILWNLGIKIKPDVIILIGFGIMFYYCGILCENSKMNWFIGIRTPWTLSSESVWDKTHKIGGKLFKIAGIVSIFGIFFLKYFVFFAIIPISAVAIFTIVYSYVEYKKETK